MIWRLTKAGLVCTFLNVLRIVGSCKLPASTEPCEDIISCMYRLARNVGYLQGKAVQIAVQTDEEE